MGRNKETIGQRIGRLRTEREESQAELASSIGEIRETIKHWEAGARKIKAESIIKLADHFSVSCDYILLGDEKRRSNDMDTQKVSEYLGLSTDAVEALKGLGNYSDGQFFPENAADGLEILLGGERLSDLCAMVSDLKAGVTKYDKRVSPIRPLDSPMFKAETVTARDDDIASAITAQIEEEHPEWAGAIRLSVGFSALDELRRDIIDLFSDTVKYRTGFDFYEREIIGEHF